MRSLGIRTLGIGATLVAAAAASAGGCGGGGTSTTGATGGGTPSATAGTMSTSGSGGMTTTGTGGTTTTSTSTGTGTGGGTTTACTTTAKGQLRGSAIALTSDDKTVVAVNRDAGTVSIMSVDYTGGEPALTLVSELPVGNEPWQVAINACNTTAYVVLRKDQKVVEITGIGSAAPALGKSFPVGSEPTSLALTPNNTQLYVSNWVDGTLSVIDPTGAKATTTIDLNATIAATGFLGPDVMAAPRAALAHPRAIAITNNGDASDTDETVYVTEFFAVRTKPEDPTNLAGSDVNWKGLLYKVPVMTGAATTIDLPSLANTGFNDAKGAQTGCFPNQVASVTIDGTFAYVTSTCASPVGPVGVFQFGTCQINANCAAFGATSTCDFTKGGVCTGSCTSDAQCGVGSAAGACAIPAGGTAGECAPFAANAKTTTHPGLTIVDLTAGTGTTTNLDAPFTNTTTPTSSAVTMSGTASARMPLLPTDVDFRPGFGYVAAEGADALFRLTITAGKITAVGATNDFIDLRTAASATIRLPIGVAVSKDQAFAFVNNDGDRDVTAVDLSTQAVATGPKVVAQAPSLAALTTAQQSQLNGKRFFNTGLGRWSLAPAGGSGAAWGSCGACHIDGLTDNVTWYFARGPRQTTSLDGTFNKADPTDQRILNWTAVNDEVADFEGNVRGISGGVGAIVSAVSSPPVNADRINTLSSTPQQQGLQGSSAATAAGGAAGAATNWADITNWIQTIRSPRAPTNLVPADVTAGAALFTGQGQGNCVGCHSGGKWTISKVFYTPGNTPNDAFGSVATTSLSTVTWDASLNGFPGGALGLFPSLTAGKQTMRSGAPPGFEQLQCVLRPVGTIAAPNAAAMFPTIPTGVSPAAVNVIELRQDMGTPLGAAGGGQGSGTQGANDFTVGFNVPSLLGVQVGAPYFHAGNARSLEEALTVAFKGHYQSAVAQIFDLNPATNTMAPTLVKQLVAYLLSIDGSTAPVAIPALGNTGGDLCHYP